MMRAMLRLAPRRDRMDRPRRHRRRILFLVAAILFVFGAVLGFLVVHLRRRAAWASSSTAAAAGSGGGASPSANPWDFLDGSADGGIQDSMYNDGCMPFQTRLFKKPRPLSAGRYHFPYVRPPPRCRTFNLSSLERVVERMRTTIRDPDLFRMFENAYPNTLDTMIKWHGRAHRTDAAAKTTVETDEELTYIITGDIDAMWLRDSAAQMLSYRSLLEAEHHDRSAADADADADADTATLAQLWRGLINLQARYLLTSPYCHSFQPPVESGIPPTTNGAFSKNHPFPAYDPSLVFDCKWELDSPAYFLQVSAAYFETTGDAAFFGRHRWVAAVEAAVDAAAAMRAGTYDAAGHVQNSAYSFTGWTDRGTETLSNMGRGNPSRANGMVRSSFRPSDDATIFQFLVPANMMWAASLERASRIMEQLARANAGTDMGTTDDDRRRQHVAANLTRVMRQFAAGVRDGIARDTVVHHRLFGDVFAYEVDGYGGVNLMDDANIPSLLSIPLLGFLDEPLPSHGQHEDRTALADAGLRHELEQEEAQNQDRDQAPEPKHDYVRIYQNTRRFVLSAANPYFAWGTPSGLAAVGGPHTGPGMAWPMAAIMTALTTYYYKDSGSAVQASWPDGTDGPATPSHAYASDRDGVVAEQLTMLLNSTWGAGVMHESIDTWAPQVWTRPWFGWANGLFGELILAIAADDVRRPHAERLLGRSWQ